MSDDVPQGLDRFIEDGLFGEDRRRYEEACSDRDRDELEPTRPPSARYQQYLKEAAEARAKLASAARFDQLVAWLVTPGGK